MNLSLIDQVDRELENVDQYKPYFDLFKHDNGSFEYFVSPVLVSLIGNFHEIRYYNSSKRRSNPTIQPRFEILIHQNLFRAPKSFKNNLKKTFEPSNTYL